MPEENILPQTPTKSEPHKEGRKTAFVAVLLTIALTIALIILGERLLYDINRWFNPAHDRFGYAPSALQEIFAPTVNAMILGDPPYPYEPSPSSYSRQDYETYRLLLHAAVIIPLFLLMFVIYYFLHFKRQGSPYRILATSYLVFAFWVIFRLLGEVSWYTVKNYKTLGVYVVLGIIIAVFTTLIIIIQKRLHSKVGAP